MSDLPDLKALAAPWIDRLRLTDWNIRVEWARYHELDAGKAGSLSWNIERRAAKIKIIVPNDTESDSDGALVPPEEVLVHELLHIVFMMLDDNLNATADILFEQALNATAAALVTLVRQRDELQERWQKEHDMAKALYREITGKGKEE